MNKSGKNTALNRFFIALLVFASLPLLYADNPPHHIAFVTQTRTLIAGTTIQFTGTDIVGVSIGSTTVDAYNPYSATPLKMPITLYDNRTTTISVIRVELRDIFDNVTTSTQPANLRYTCLNSNNAHASESADYQMMDNHWTNICVSQAGGLFASIPPNNSSHALYFFDTEVGTKTIQVEGNVGDISLTPTTQNVYITPGTVRYFTLHHSYPVTSPLSVQIPGSITVKARDRYGNIVAGDSTNGQYYTGQVGFSHNGSTVTVTLKAMPGNATYYTFVRSDAGQWSGLQVTTLEQVYLGVWATGYALIGPQAVDYPPYGEIHGYLNDTVRTESVHSSGILVTGGIKVSPLPVNELLNGTQYASREKLYQGDGNTQDNFQSFNMLGLQMATLPTQAYLTGYINQIRVDRSRICTLPAHDITEVALYYDKNESFSFDPEFVQGGAPPDKKLATADYDAATDAWYFKNLGTIPEMTIVNDNKTYFVTVKISTTATTPRIFGLSMKEYYYIASTGTAKVAADNFEIKSSTWYVEKTPPRVYAIVDDIAAYYKAEGETEASRHAGVFQGDTNVGMLRFSLFAPEFHGVLGNVTIMRTGTGSPPDVEGMKLFMDGKDMNNDGRIDPATADDGVFQAGGDMELSDWIPFDEASISTCTLSVPQLIDSTTRHFFIVYKFSSSAQPGPTHGVNLYRIGLNEGNLQPRTNNESTQIPVYATVDAFNLYAVNGAGFAPRGYVVQGDTNVPVARLTLGTPARTALWKGIKIDRSFSRNSSNGQPEGVINKPSDIDRIAVWYDENKNGQLETGSYHDGNDPEVSHPNPSYCTLNPDTGKTGFPYSTLSIGIDSNATQIKVGDISRFFPASASPFVNAPGKLIIEDGSSADRIEVVTYSGVDLDNNLFTGVSRGQDMTTAIAHPAGVLVSGSAIITLRGDAPGGVSGTQEIGTDLKNYFVTYDFSPLCTVNSSLKIGLEIPSTSYFSVVEPDYVANASSKIGLNPPRGNGAGESNINQVKEYADTLVCKPANTIGVDNLVQGSKNNAVYQFTLEADKADALWYTISVFSTGTAVENGKVRFPDLMDYRMILNYGLS